MGLMLILSERDLKQIIRIRDVIQVVNEAFLELAQIETESPKRTILEVKDGAMLFMPAYLPVSKSLTLKIVGFYPENPIRWGKDTITSILCLLDPETGSALAIMDGKHITAMRTAAMTAIATDHLARRNVSSIGIIGAGVQAEYQLKSILEVRRAQTIYIYDILRDKSRILAEKVREGFEGSIMVVDKPDQAVSNSDILIVATTSRQPVLDGSILPAGIHIASIGWVGPKGRELDTTTVKRSRLVVDTKEGVLAESGDILIPLKAGEITEEHIWCELKDLVSGRKQGRLSEEEITLWKSVGVGIADAATARLAYSLAEEEGLGLRVEL